ncbi:hypothetical protein HYV81_06075 [Candidatus Woesearchaeota archaeon]|nr:hypothetical protein [Candidatus Woesearchaeota archaeon]
MKWFTRFFTKEKPKERPHHKVQVHELDAWFKGKVSSKLDAVQDDTNRILSELRQEIQATREKLHKLETAQLQNPNIPMRAKQFMEGNREAYIRAIRQVLPAVDASELEPLEIPAFTQKAKQRFEHLARNAHKPYTVLQEFLANEAAAVARSLKIILAVVEKLEAHYKDAGLAEIQAMEQSISAINNKIVQKQTLAKLTKQLEQEIAALNTIVSALEAEKQALMASERYKQYTLLKQEKAAAHQQLKELEQSFIDHFQAVEPALKRFAKRSTHEEHINRYLSHPVAALMDDEVLGIIPVLQALEQNISSNSVQLNDRKEKKTLDKIQLLNRAFLADFREKRQAAAHAILGIAGRLETTKVEETLAAHNQKLTDEQYRLENKSQQLAHARKELEKIDVARFSEDLAARLSVFFNEQVSLTP